MTRDDVLAASSAADTATAVVIGEADLTGVAPNLSAPELEVALEGHLRQAISTATRAVFGGSAHEAAVPFDVTVHRGSVLVGAMKSSTSGVSLGCLSRQVRAVRSSVGEVFQARTMGVVSLTFDSRVMGVPSARRLLARVCAELQGGRGAGVVDAAERQTR